MVGEWEVYRVQVTLGYGGAPLEENWLVSSVQETFGFSGVAVVGE